MDNKEMNSSDVLPEDWAIINSSSSDIGEKEESEQPEINLSPSLEANTDGAHAGSTVQEVVPDAPDEFYNESNTSSDIDIIDDFVDDSANISYDYTITDDSSVIENETDDNNGVDDTVTISGSSTVTVQQIDDQTATVLAEENVGTRVKQIIEDEASKLVLSTATRDNSLPPAYEHVSGPSSSPPRGPEPRRHNGATAWFRDYFMPMVDSLMQNTTFVHIATALMISFSFVIMFNTTELKVDSFQALKMTMNNLQRENANLRSQILSKMENDKLLHGLEEQIGDLKTENSRLSSSLRSLLYQLEKQTVNFKKDQRGKGPYKEEFEKLKEQINILRNDNNDLQSQLKRLKYSTTPKHHEKQEDKAEVKEDGDNSNTTESLTEQIQELKKVLNSEVEKLKEWKEGILNLVTKFGNLPNNYGENNQEKPADQSKFKEEKDFWFLKDLKKNLEKKLWSLQDLKDNLERSVEKMDILEMLKSVSKDSKKKAEGAFESVSHYFRKAQEKTKKIFDLNNNENELWKFVGELRKKWVVIRNDFFDNHYNKMKTTEGDGETSANPDYVKPDQEERSHEKPPQPQHPNLRRRSTSLGEDLYKLYGSGDAEEPEKEEDHSWMFERARRRSNLRKLMEEDVDTNWYLRPRRELDETGDEE